MGVHQKNVQKLADIVSSFRKSDKEKFGIKDLVSKTLRVNGFGNDDVFRHYHLAVCRELSRRSSFVRTAKKKKEGKKLTNVQLRLF